MAGGLEKRMSAKPSAWDATPTCTTRRRLHCLSKHLQVQQHLPGSFLVQTKVQKCGGRVLDDEQCMAACHGAVVEQSKGVGLVSQMWGGCAATCECVHQFQARLP